MAALLCFLSVSWLCEWSSSEELLTPRHPIRLQSYLWIPTACTRTRTHTLSLYRVEEEMERSINYYELKWLMYYLLRAQSNILISLHSTIEMFTQLPCLTFFFLKYIFQCPYDSISARQYKAIKHKVTFLGHVGHSDTDCLCSRKHVWKQRNMAVVLQTPIPRMHCAGPASNSWSEAINCELNSLMTNWENREQQGEDSMSVWSLSSWSWYPAVSCLCVVQSRQQLHQLSLLRTRQLCTACLHVMLWKSHIKLLTPSDDAFKFCLCINIDVFEHCVLSWRIIQKKGLTLLSCCWFSRQTFHYFDESSCDV